MSLFDSVDEAQSGFFIDEDLMGGETVRFCPHAGPAREISAIVNREPKAPVSEAGNTRPAVSMTVSVRNDATAGIAATTIDTGKDRIEVARRKGGPRESRAIASVRSQAAGILVLEIR